MRETSLEAFKKIKDNGLLSKRRLEVCWAIAEFGPITANGLVRKMKIKYHNAN